MVAAAVVLLPDGVPPKPAHLRSEAPLGGLQEVYALSLGHDAVRAMMAQAAAAVQNGPTMWSVAIASIPGGASRMSKFKKNRPGHRGLPPLRNRSIETVVMIR